MELSHVLSVSARENAREASPFKARKNGLCDSNHSAETREPFFRSSSSSPANECADAPHLLCLFAKLLMLTILLACLRSC